jgi:beta-glucosidase
MDNFEWAEGYSLRFGLIDVDFSDSQRKRTPKASFHWYQDVIKKNAICA